MFPTFPIFSGFGLGHLRLPLPELGEELLAVAWSLRTSFGFQFAVFPLTLNPSPPMRGELLTLEAVSVMPPYKSGFLTAKLN
jgi:hypothetical protein